jgi:hypothetical protein
MEPCDEKWIIENMTKFRNMLNKKCGDKAKGGSPGNSKKHWNKQWAPPQPHEHNKLVIKGKAMWFNKFNKCWVPDKESKEANLAGATKEVANTKPNAVPSADTVSMANQLKQLQATFTSFKEQMLLDDN